MENPVIQPAPLAPEFSHPSYLFRRKMLKLFGGRIDIYDPAERPVMCCLQKAFKLKEDITIYADDSKTRPLLAIKARNIIDFSAAYDVTDPQTGEHLGLLRRKGLRSMLRDQWEILNAREQVIAMAEEDSMAMAVLRRALDFLEVNLVPQSFHITANDGVEIGRASQRFNPFIHRMDLRISQEQAAGRIDPRLLIALTTLLVLIEGRQ
jgi:uncharacterized protein YxjI